MDTYNFIVLVKTEDIYVDFAIDTEKEWILQITKQIDHYPEEKIKKYVRQKINERVC